MIESNMNKKIILILFLINSLLVLFLYRNSFSSYFFQDDWFTLKISSAKNIGDFLNFFIPRTDVIYYRPLGMQVYFFILQLLFGLKSFPFHATAFITHIANSGLIFLISLFLTKNKIQSVLISILYASSAVHFTPFYWASTYPFILGPGLTFLSFYSFLIYDKAGHNKWLLLSGMAYVSAIFTNEMAIVFPVLAFLYALLFSPKRIKSTFIFFIISLLFLGRLIFFRPPTVGTYAFAVNRTSFYNLLGFGMWTFNWPEDMKAQMVSLGKFNPVFISEFYSYYTRFMTSFGILFISLFIIPFIYTIIKKTKNNTMVKIIIFGSLWYFAGLFPVLFFPNHTFSYYLPISLFGFLILSTSFLFKAIKSSQLKIALSSVVLGAWLISSEASTDFNQKIHWAPRRAKRSQELTLTIAEKKRQQPDREYFYIFPASENKLALNDQDGLQVYFKDKNMKTIYAYGEN